MKRHGTTLIEVLAILSLLLTLGVSATLMLKSLTRIGAESRDASRYRASVMRLSNEFRSDVRNAQAIREGDRGALLAIEPNDNSETVFYRFDSTEHEILRQVEKDGESIDVEAFNVPPESTPKIRIEGAVVSLNVRTLGSDDVDSQAWVIEGVKR